MFLQWLVAATGVAILLGVVRLLMILWLRPLQIYEGLRKQGVQGPPFVPIMGNQPELVRLLDQAASTPTNRSSNEIVPRILPYYTKWSNIYVISDPELMKEILSNKFGHFPKETAAPASRDLMGDGLVLAKGEKWAKQRRILSHGFHVEMLKAMVETMAEVTSKILNNWERRIVDRKQPKGVEIEVLEEYENLTADIIARTAFDTNYEVGKTVFQLQHDQQEMGREAAKSIRLPGKSFLPTVTNFHRWRIRKTVEDKLHQIVQKRLQLESQNEVQHNDLLGLMVSAYKGQLRSTQKNLRMSIQDIVDECKTFFVAGHETTALMLTWTTMLLALHPQWQQKVRAEVINVCGSRHPSSDMLNQLKSMGMVLNEALRLYPIAPVLIRCTDRDMKLGKLVIPKGTVLHLLLLAMMHNKELWGQDADDFNPDRFSEGIANAARHPSAYMPFSIGPRNCIGQVFALMEAKVVLCKLLQRFSFELSPTYAHAPRPLGLLRPQHGMQVLVKPIDS
ncbi:hypothetical protein O6H91_23G030500 [Diphasiastrum complanatum]|uniref:Uncharacterized protein n=1 Tax=Diphasiastrum complanatum TaxID=34168 RepID=A0ACC2ABB7_DIPCM|nr:hypothetical protein O6H91_23G030500 [Diphasiastrum complanatum]